MTGPAVTSLPSGRALLGWWRELAAHRPQRLWFAHLSLLRIETLVEIAPPAPLANLCQALLPLLARHESPFSSDVLAAHLQADTALLDTLLTELQRAGLIRAVRAGTGGSAAWEVLPASTTTSATASTKPVSSTHAPGSRSVRRSFSFTAEGPPLYLPLLPTAAAQSSASTGAVFDLASLESCVARGHDWKVRAGFPEEVVRVIRPSPTADDWRAIPLARAEQAHLALIEISDHGDVLGFSVRPDPWTLTREAVLRVPGGAETLKPLLDGPDVKEWRNVFQLWCQQRNLPAAEGDSCQLTLSGHRLVVKAPARLIERLRAARSDAVKGEAWLLAGHGSVKAAAQIDLVEMG